MPEDDKKSFDTKDTSPSRSWSSWMLSFAAGIATGSLIGPRVWNWLLASTSSSLARMFSRSVPTQTSLSPEEDVLPSVPPDSAIVSSHPSLEIQESAGSSAIISSLSMSSSNQASSSSRSKGSNRATRTGAVQPRGELKMVLVVRTDLKMDKGKIAAQCCHACLGAYKEAVRQRPDFVRMWEKQGQTKVAVKVSSEEELLDLNDIADGRGIPTCLVADAGRTQIAAGSLTVLALGPAPVEEIDSVTGSLKLL